MKKTLIAIAALAATGAFAQSSVTLYGRVDAYAGTLKNTLHSNSTPAESQTVINSGGLNTNRWGIKGSEDLGNDLKANFQLEQGFALDKGSAIGDQFDRYAWVGLSGRFGEIQIGRNYTAFDDLRGNTNQVANTNLGATYDVWEAGGTDYKFNQKNQIKYLSPSWNGFSGGASVALGENKNLADADPKKDNSGHGSTDVYALQLRYTNGPLLVGYGHQTEEQLAGAPSIKYDYVGGAYDFGVAKAVGGYQRARDGNGARQAYQVGLQVPYGSFNFYAGYAKSSADELKGKNHDVDGYSLVATYALSKRTDTYLGYKNLSEKNATVADGVGAKAGEKRQFSVGLRHFF